MSSLSKVKKAIFGYDIFSSYDEIKEEFELDHNQINHFENIKTF